MKHSIITNNKLTYVNIMHVKKRKTHTNILLVGYLYCQNYARQCEVRDKLGVRA
jgi:hypothetical protein